MSKEIKVGDKISALGHVYEVAKILHQEYWDRDGFDCEFIDPHGGYHHWKQWYDGGVVIHKEKKYKNCYGNDVTDLFKKYGY